MADVMLGQFRDLGFKRNSAAASMVDGKLDTVGDQNPADALVFLECPTMVGLLSGWLSM